LVQTLFDLQTLHHFYLTVIAHLPGKLVLKEPLTTVSPAAKSALRFYIACFMRVLSWPPATTPC